MYRFLVLAIFLSFGAIPSAMSSSNPPLEKLALSQTRSIVLNDTSIGGLKIGMSEDEVVKKLGTPKSRQVEANGCTETTDISLKYNNLVIYLLGGSSKKSKSYLVSITTTNSRYVTNQEIRVGDLMNKAEKAYAKAAVIGEKGRYLSLADRQQNECALTFLSNNSKTVSEINLACAIC